MIWGGGVADAVWQWAQEAGDRPNWRIALCGMEGDYPDPPAGWRVHLWRNAGGIGGRGAKNKPGEVVLFSPHCLAAAETRQPALL